MEKVIRDGLVAVLYSPDYGAGWSTWNNEYAMNLCMDARIVGPFLEHWDKEEIEEARLAAMYATEKLFPKCSISGANNLCVEWIPQGCFFKIECFDGCESVEYIPVPEGAMQA